MLTVADSAGVWHHGAQLFALLQAQHRQHGICVPIRCGQAERSLSPFNGPLGKWLSSMKPGLTGTSAFLLPGCGLLHAGAGAACKGAG